MLRSLRIGCARSRLSFLGILAFLVTLAAPAYGATLTVCGSGCGYTTIKDAIAAASAGDTISVTDSSHQETTPIAVNKNLTIQGQGAASTTVHGDGSASVFTVAPATVTIQNMTISGGNGATLGGGGIFNLGTLTVSNSTLSGNSSGSSAPGGGILNAGTLTVSNSTLSGNSSTSGGGISSAGTLTVSNSTLSNNSGGGILNFSGTATISNSALSGNSGGNMGGGISIAGGILTVTDSTLSGNTASFGGGFLSLGGTLTINNTTVSGNSAGSGGGIASSGASLTIAINNSTLSGNSAGSGGGIFSNGGTLTLSKSTLSGNAANAAIAANALGGGIFNYATGILIISNSTLSDNTASSGGGIFNNSTLTISNSTLAGNSASTAGGGGIVNFNATLNAKSTIIASTAGGDCVLSGGSTSWLGKNFDTDGSCGSGFTTTSAALKLGPLQVNAPGTTATRALLTGSVAVDAASDCNNYAGTPVTSDQRGVSRPQGTQCDVGAYEMIPDTTIPSITITVPAQTSYLLNHSVAADYSCSDSGSGVKSCTGTVASGSNIDTATPGAKTFTVDALDNAGNPNTQTVNYSVVEPVTDANISITPNGTHRIGQSHTFTAHVNVDAGEGAGFVNAPDGTQISFAIDSGPGSFTTPNPCATTGGTGSCTIALTSATPGVTTVSAQSTVTVGAGTLVRTTDGLGGNSAPETATWVAPLSIAKSFGLATVPLNGTTSLTFTITNASPIVQTSVAFGDNLPGGLVVATSPNASNNCGGTLVANGGAVSLSLSGGSVAANDSCTIQVDVKGVGAGQQHNVSGAVTSTEGGTGNTGNATLTVAAPPTVTKSFGAASVLLNATTSLTLTINNPNTTLGLTSVAVSDTLPAGLAVASPNGLSTTCSGTVTAATGSGSLSLTGAALAANASCTIAVNVTGTQAGVQNNTTGPISSFESGPGATSNTASVTVIGPPSIAKAFGAASISLNATTTLTFTITDPNATVALTGVSFGDTLPAGLTVANPNGLTGACGAGTITTGTVSGFSVVNLSGGTIAAGGSCTFSVNVVGISGGHKVNTTGSVASSNAGSGNTATASIDVLAPDLAISKTHAGTLMPGQTGAQYLLTVSNVGFGPTVGTVTVTDTLPNVANPPVPTAISGTGWTCTLGTLTCTRSDGLASGSSHPAITLTVNVPINTSATLINTATVSGGGDVNPANNTATDTASLVLAPTIAKAFGAPTVALNGSTSLTFTIQNPNASLALSAIAFTDDLPAGLVVASPNGLSNTCGGSPAATAASSSVSLSGGTVAANSSCTLSISVTGTAAGVKNNTTGTLSSAESGVGAISNTATMTVLAPPTIAKAFGAATLLDNATTSLTFTLANPNSTASLTGVGFTDTLPSGLTVATPNGQSGSCGGGTITATAGSNTVSLSGASLAASGSCVFSVNVSRTGTGNQLNVTGNVTSGNGGSGNTASAAVIAVQRTFTGPTATGGVGTATITTANGGNACGFTHAQWLPLSSAPPTPLPLGFPQGLFDFTVGNCQPGFSMVLTLTFDSALPPGTSYWKYGPTSDNASWHWYIMPGTVNGNVVTLNFTDGALGDDDLSASNGIIQDQGGPAFALQATTVPTLQRWVLALLILLFVAMAAAVMRQGRRAR